MRKIFGSDTIQPLPGALERAEAFQNAVNERSEKIDRCVNKCFWPNAMSELRTDIGVFVLTGIAVTQGATTLATRVIPVFGWGSTAYSLYSFEQCREDCMRDPCM